MNDKHKNDQQPRIRWKQIILTSLLLAFLCIACLLILNILAYQVLPFPRGA